MHTSSALNVVVTDLRYGPRLQTQTMDTGYRQLVQIEAVDTG